jgi:hypothetical protein
MVYDLPSHINRLTAESAVSFLSKEQSEVLMATSRTYLLGDEIEQNLLEELASDQSSFSDEIDSSGTDDLTVGEVIGAEYSDEESDVHFLQHAVRRVLYLRGRT